MKKNEKLFYGQAVDHAHTATILPDKSLQADIFRQMYFGSYYENGRAHEDRQVQIFADEVFLVKYGNQGIFFIPVIPLNSDRELEKVPIPIFMLDLKIHDRAEIKKYGTVNGYNIEDYHFSKPRISVTYDERIDRGLESNDEIVDDFDHLEILSENIIQGKKMPIKTPDVKNKHLIPISDWLKKWQAKTAEN